MQSIFWPTASSLHYTVSADSLRQ